MKMLNKLAPLVLALILSLSLPLAAETPAGDPTTKNQPPLSVDDYFKPLSPEKIHTATSINILKNLKHRHFRSMDIDDDFSKGLLDNFLEDLDGSRIYFLESDIKKFGAYTTQLDNALKKGDLAPAYAIFNTYQQRMIERLIYLIDQLTCCYDALDFAREETYESDRKDLPWIASTSQMNDIWRKRLKNDILTMKLSEKPQGDIREMLEKRYRNQLNRAGQIKSEDVFRIYMNSFTRMYDPHTQYFSPRASEDFNIRMSLSLEGIGALLQTENEYTKVLRLVPAGPADKSGLLKAGDRIIAVGQDHDGELVDVVGWRLDDVVQLIRGPKDTVVQLKIIPSSATDVLQTKVIRITRNTVKLEEQAAKKTVVSLEDAGKTYKIGVITIPTFYIDFNAYQSKAPDYKSTTRDVEKLLDECKAEHVDGIIVDLRENGGGALHEATSLTGLFIKTGPTVIVRSPKDNYSVYPDDNPDIAYTGPLAVLVNRMSASASEIFAGAIRDQKRGIILGSQTFGKGTVQSLLDLNKGQLKLTVAKFYRILGESTQHKGIIPDIQFPSLYNPDEIGESALEEALPWDTTTPVRFNPYMDIDLKAVIERLNALHQSRVKDSPDYKYLIEYNNHFKELQKKSTVSLNEKERLKEQEQAHQWLLNLENTLRLAKGEKPFDNYEELKKFQESQVAEDDQTGDEDEGAETKKGAHDVVLDESRRILIDYIRLLKQAPKARS
ncbi:carboxy terminal-processing peptidase [Desulfatiferula olefinivorans]